MNNTPDPFDDLESDDLSAAVGKTTEKKKYPCGHCNGSGTWVSPLGRVTGKCHACRGRGHFLTSPNDRFKAKQSRIKSHEKKRNKWIEKHQALYDYLKEVSSWNDFALSLVNAINKYGSLTDGQLKAAEKSHVKHVEYKKTKATEHAKADAAKPVIDLTKINELFDNAKNSGLKKPVLRINMIQISIAPLHGKNAGCLYVKDNNQYAGKITEAGKFWGLKTTRSSVEDELIELAKDPMKLAVAYGRRTGNCACCGRELTNSESIELGIGPVCREKWGF